jgi:hypothetical protein
MARGRKTFGRKGHCASLLWRPGRGHDFMAAHQLRDGRRGRSRKIGHGTGNPAVAQHHAAMGERLHLVQLVGNEDDAQSLPRHGA